MSASAQAHPPELPQVSDSSTATSDLILPGSNSARLDSVLRLEILLREPQLDLDDIVNTVVSDPQLESWLNRLARDTFEDPRSAPTRIADCVIEIGRDHLIASLKEVPLLRSDSR